MKKMMYGLLAVGLVVSLANAELLVYESFNYGMSSDVTVSGNSYTAPAGSGLTGSWTSSNTQSFFNAGQLNYPTSAGLTSQPGQIACVAVSTAPRSSTIQMSNAIDFDSDGTYYISYMFKQYAGVAGSSQDNSYFYVNLRSNTNNDALFKTGWGWASGVGVNHPILVGANDGLNNVAVNLYTTDTTSQIHMVVGKLVTSATGNDVLYIGAFNTANPADIVPDSANDMVWSASLSSSITGTASYLQLLTGQNGKFITDEVRIGTQWVDVTGNIPEPTTMCLLAAGAIAGLSCRRKR